MAKPDNRADNAEKLKKMKENTKHNMEAAKEAVAHTDMSREQKKAVKAKNKRRKESMKAFDEEIADEIDAREQGYNKQK
ncbi:small acid-soluble spore protein Tlp [Halalkalibacter oceani]|uniref:Small, acid-soluble spore protein Tlp n=1 Tax=Halalkalibacter oceani TaxID=1653776 RepID=A0A9X2DMC1_9BACI|nr:small acid-soluble spore protein Tlp [Halalkalibacter oceani]MCM3713411.1 small acid-soluble spore protein Tlp [Halalkalibacter oceani]